MYLGIAASGVRIQIVVNDTSQDDDRIMFKSVMFQIETLIPAAIVVMYLHTMYASLETILLYMRMRTCFG